MANKTRPAAAPAPTAATNDADKALAPFFNKENAPTKPLAKLIAGWTFYHYPKVDGERTRALFKMEDELEDPRWVPDPWKFDDAEMGRVFPEGIYDVEAHRKDGTFLARRRNVVVGNPDREEDDDDGRDDDNGRVDGEGEVATLQNDPDRIITVKGLTAGEQAAFVTAQQNAADAQKRADREREALEAERKALREQMMAPQRGGDSELCALLREQVSHLREEKMKLESTLRDEKTNAVQTLREDHQKEITRRDTLEITLRTDHSKALLDLEARLRNEFRLEREAFDTKLKAAEQRADDQHKRVMELERQLLDEIRKADTDNLRLNQNLLTVDAKREAAEAAAKAKQSGDSAGKIEMMREAINGVKEAAKIAKDLGAGPDMEKKILEAVEKALKGKALGNGAAG